MTDREPTPDDEVATSPSATLAVRRPDPGSVVLTLPAAQGATTRRC